tara:strand:- start:111 stop:821 length:711 start_codon:yes stop_codon:yes gene_type:complete
MKNVLVTGCSRGIGFEIVKTFSMDNDINILAVSRDKSGLSRLQKECVQINKDCNLTVLSLDLLDLKSISLIVEFVKKDFNGSLNGIIHNAGFLIKKTFTDISNEELENSFQVNCFAPFRLTQQLVPFFTKKAHILSISSMGGLQGSKKFPGLSVYSTSKATLITLTECLAEEFKMTDFHFNCLALGAVQTEMLSKAFPGYNAPVNSNEMGQFIGDFFLNGPKYFNGQVIPISLTTP